MLVTPLSPGKGQSREEPAVNTERQSQAALFGGGGVEAAVLRCALFCCISLSPGELLKQSHSGSIRAAAVSVVHKITHSSAAPR